MLFDNLLQDKHLEGNSVNWKNWESELSWTTCKYCAEMHGTIYSFDIDTDNLIPAHENGRCKIVPMRTKMAGTATEMGLDGADAYLAYVKHLPEYYVSKQEAEDAGWVTWKGNLDEILPGSMIGGDIFKNKEGKLPVAPGRIWYEADINYSGGFRNRQRMLYSNDGLIFATYDHYETFYEIIR